MGSIGTLAHVGAACGIVWLLTGCDSTIHKETNVGGVQTLSVDAKQRLMLVGTRVRNRVEPGEGLEPPKRVTCTEPSPDALVARAASLAGNVNVSGSEGQGGGGLSASSSEAAASIGFRDSTIQMLRDGYYRLCEVYMNGAISKGDFEHMALNVDTFMAVVSALQILGTNPIAPAVAISASGATARSNVAITSTGPEPVALSPGEITAATTRANVAADNANKAAADANKATKEALGAADAAKQVTNAKEAADASMRAQVVRNIVGAYLRHRDELNIKLDRMERAQQRAGRG